MTSNRPYLVRAIYEWITDNGLTPHLVVDAHLDEVTVPTQFVEDGKIVLNVAQSSVRGLELGNDYILFSARFSGKHFDVTVPNRAVLAIYARENGKGLAFPPDDDQDPPPTGDETVEPTPAERKPALRVVK
ncbi:MAG: stringent starvation protein B [Gammaproteobacteria bacterium]|jgi:stringent starvation protein B